MGWRDQIAKAMTGIKAYHSSPHDFDRFDLSKIGTGEGAQVYGHGLYFAENPKVSGQGGQYWDQFVSRFGGPESTAAKELQFHGFDRDKAAESMRSRIMYPDEALPADVIKRQLDLRREALRLLESGKPVGPRTYEVNINADPAHMLDWDRALDAQNPQVTGGLTSVFDKRYGKGFTSDYIRQGTDFRDIYNNFDDFDPAQMSAMLNEAGIPGVKYLDGAARAAGTGSSNYVVFDPSIIDITKKYAVPGAVGAGAIGSLAAQDQYEVAQ